MGIWVSTDPKEQLFNSYGYSTNPINTVDPDGQYVVGAIIGAIAGAYLGGAMSNGSFNPGKWDWDNAGTWTGMIGGAVSGASLGSGIENNIIASRMYNGQISSAYGAAGGRHLLQTGFYDSYLASKGMQPTTLTDAFIINRHDAVYGAGHQAIVVGNDDIGYYYFSKDAKSGLGANTSLDFDSFYDFLDATDPHNGLSFRDSYSSAYRIITTPEQDIRMLDYAFENYQKPYGLFRNNCSDLVGSVLDAGGINGYTSGWTWPNIQYNKIQFNYAGARIPF